MNKLQLQYTFLQSTASTNLWRLNLQKTTSDAPESMSVWELLRLVCRIVINHQCLNHLYLRLFKVWRAEILQWSCRGTKAEHQSLAAVCTYWILLICRNSSLLDVPHLNQIKTLRLPSSLVTVWQLSDGGRPQEQPATKTNLFARPFRRVHNFVTLWHRNNSNFNAFNLALWIKCGF